MPIKVDLRHGKPSLWDLRTGELVELVASTKPTPGGGSTAIMVACMGAALLKKAAAVSLEKKSRQRERSSELEAMIRQINKWDEVQRKNADSDSAGFEDYMRALGLPRGNQTQARTREKAVEEAMVRATSMPIAAADEIQRITMLGLSRLALIHNVILSDAVVGLRLLNSSAICLLTTGEANMLKIEKSPFRSALRRQLRELARAATQVEPELACRLNGLLLARNSKIPA